MRVLRIFTVPHEHPPTLPFIEFRHHHSIPLRDLLFRHHWTINLARFSASVQRYVVLFLR